MRLLKWLYAQQFLEIQQLGVHTALVISSVSKSAMALCQERIRGSEVIGAKLSPLKFGWFTVKSPLLNCHLPVEGSYSTSVNYIQMRTQQSLWCHPDSNSWPPAPDLILQLPHSYITSITPIFSLLCCMPSNLISLDDDLWNVGVISCAASVSHLIIILAGLEHS